MKKEKLYQFFHPQSVAVIGASAKPGKVGNDIMVNLQKTFSGKIYPINLDDKEIAGLKAYKSILKVVGKVDLAVIAIPAKFVPQVVVQCGQKKCHNIVIISAGFRETGEGWMKLEQKINSLIKKYGIRLLGPNCLGYISTLLPINASFSADTPNQGNIAFFSQSGALGTAILDMVQAQKFGFGYFVSMGNKLDIGEIDLLEYFGSDSKTKVILAYLEDIRDGSKFISVASKISKKKPIIVLKSGKTESGQRAVSSHTGSLAGSVQAYSSAFSQSGIIEAQGVADFFDFAEGFSLQPLPRGNRVAVVTNAGGPGIILTDLLPQNGLELAELSSATINKLKKVLPVAASTINPVDVLGDAGSDRYGLAIEAVLKDNHVDSLAVVLTPQKMTDIKGTVKVIGKLSRQYKKTIVLCFMGEYKIVKNYPFFKKYSLPQYAFPLQSVKVLGKMLEYSQWKNKPLLMTKPKDYKKYYNNTKVKKVIKKSALTETDARNILEPLGFPLHSACLVKNKEQAIKCVNEIKYPVALKVVSAKIVHKSDVGGVKLNIKNDQKLSAEIIKMKKKFGAVSGYLVGEMVKGTELIIGMKHDPQFGPLVMVGAGGIYAEIFNDVAFRVAPISRSEAMEMISELKIYKILKGVRGQKSADIDAVAEVLVKLGDFALQFKEIKEIDFNPVMVMPKGKGCKIVDIRFLK